MKKYMLLTLFLIIVVASPVSAGGRGRGRGHGGACYKHAQRGGNPGFYRGRAPYRGAYRAYPAYGYYSAPAYPVYVAPAPVYVYPAYPPPPPPPVYEPYYHGPRVRGHVGVDIVF